MWMPPAVIEAHHVLQAGERSVVHVGGGQRHVTQGRGFVAPAVGRYERHLIATEVGCRRFAHTGNDLWSHFGKDARGKLHTGGAGVLYAYHAVVPAQASVMKGLIGKQGILVGDRVTGDALGFTYK